jgi:methionyl-tRNA formyltransferase
MKIFFIGTVDFSKYALAKLINMDVEISGVATKAESPFNADFADLKPLCKKKNIPYRLVDNINDGEVLAWIRRLQPDIIFCWGWSELLKKRDFEFDTNGCDWFSSSGFAEEQGPTSHYLGVGFGFARNGINFFLYG